MAETKTSLADIAIRKLGNGQELTDAERKAIGMSPTTKSKAATDDDRYYTEKVGTTGKTQAQLDAAKGAAEVATLVGGTVDPITGYPVGPSGPSGPSGPGSTGPTGPTGPGKKKLVSTYIDPETGDVINVYDDETEVIVKKGTKALDAAAAAAAAKAEKRAAGQSAFDLLTSEFDAFGMGALIAPLRQFIEEGISRDEFVLRLRGTDAYKKRFAANAQRVAKGLRALSEAEYIGMEDQYQNVMRQYGLPDSYYTRGEMGRQEGFEKFLAGDVSAVELEDRISTAQKRVINANPEVTQALKEFYPDITNGDILAYTLDPTNAIENIKRKVTAAEIGGAAIQSGLQTGVSRADELRAAGITKESAQQGFGTIAGGLQRGSQLASIYGENPYTQTTAEQEVFNIAGAQEARKQRQKITGLEKATFSGQTGLSSSALARDRAGAY